MRYRAGNSIDTLSTRERSAVSLTPHMDRFPVAIEQEARFEILPVRLKTHTKSIEVLNRGKLLPLNGPFNDKSSKSSHTITSLCHGEH